MVLVCSVLEMSKAGSGPNSPNSLGVGTCIGSVLAVSMTLRQRSSHRLSEFVPGTSIQVLSIIQGVLGGGVGRSRAGRRGGESRRRCRRRGCAGVVVASAGWGLRLVPRMLLWPGPLLVLTAPVACVAGAGECCGEDLRRGERERREIGLWCDRLERWWGREGECDWLQRLRVPAEARAMKTACCSEPWGA